MELTESGSTVRNRVFEFSQLVSGYYYPSAVPDNPYVGRNEGFSQIYIVIDGEGYYTLEDKRYHVSSGMMFYCPPGTKFSYWWEERRSEYALISFVSRSEAMKLFEDGPIMLCEEEKKILMDTIRTTTYICDYSKIKKPPRIEMYVKSDTPDVIIGYIYASLERFLSILYCRLRGIDIIINENQKISKKLEGSLLINGVKEYLSEHVDEQIRIDDICKCFGVSPTVLIEKFRKETNKTIIEYFNELKIGKAKIMISNSSASFTDISEKLGFSSLNYFSKLFKKKTGMTLTEYSCLASKREAITKKSTK